ncbi:hypothetical protein Daesc_004510 [Daldinia eschscholtzii]|uniref:Uncharacterized protein n=1 Tax=Daldinia eschscholtzii TaxID=292717 RepID=A0AAX6MQ30_9PEZI
MRKVMLLMSTYVLGAYAVTYGPVDYFSAFTDPKDRIDPEAREVLRNANRNPTLTRSLPYKPFQGSWSYLPEDSVLRNAQWTWRINVSDVVAPSAESQQSSSTSGPITDPHVASTTYDFTWSTEGNMSTALGGAPGPLCFVQLGDWVDLPVNVTNLYTEDSAQSTSCVPVLGEACVNAILAAEKSLNSEYCFNPQRKLWSELPECQSSFGYSQKASHHFDLFSSGLSLYDNRTTNSTSDDLFWESGQAFYRNVSEPLNGSNSQTFLQNSNRLHVLLLSTTLPDPTNPTYKLSERDLLCMRVNATKLPEVDLNDDGYSLTSEVLLEKENESAGSIVSFEMESTVWISLLAIISVFLVVA